MELLNSKTEVYENGEYYIGQFSNGLRHGKGKELHCLMTNEHVITKDMIESKETIDIKYNYEKKWIQIKLEEKKDL